MKYIKNALRKIDVFGVTYTFKYKSKEKYETSLGGLFVLLFSVIACYMGIYYFIPFYKRKNFTILYYTMNLPYTETVNLKKSNAAFAIGINCDESAHKQYPIGISRDDVFNFEIKHVLYIKAMDGSFHKEKTDLSSHPCNYADFYYKYNDSIDYLNLKTYRCLDDYGNSIQGIYADQIFSYYEFTVLSKDFEPQTFSNIDKYLFYTDCKLQMYYTDITIDLDNYEKPISPYLNSLFIQLNPSLFIKRNIYFMNQYLSDDDLLFGVFGEESPPKKLETLFSRYEEYALYVGLNRSETTYPNYENYAKIYMRADTKKTEIRRTYQKVVEFFADASSLLVALFDVLIIVFNYIDSFYADYSLGKRIFMFKELEDNHFNVPKKLNQIKELLTLNVNNNIKHLDTNEIDEESKQPSKEQLLGKEEIKIYNKNRKKPLVNDDNFYKNPLKGKTEIKSKKTYKIKKKKSKVSDSIIKNVENEEDSKIKNSNVLFSLKSNPATNIYNSSDRNKTDVTKIYNTQESLINYSFNVFEILMSSFCCNFCYTKNIGLKIDLNEKAVKILNNKLDIILYVRNMILFDIINETIINDEKKEIINFLSRPTLTTTKEVKNKFVNFYENFRDEDFDKFYNGYKGLINQTNKQLREEKLISMTQKKLKELIDDKFI